jgi:hypothetical protein
MTLMSAMAEDQTFVLQDWMAGYDAVPPLERPSGDTSERLLVADWVSSTTAAY